ncbi:MAG: hypothetical protein KBT03_04995 [Bacteroidales bacterium]|nr:hypothetical protein [Candidatus Scybalousia scybalohippi]
MKKRSKRNKLKYWQNVQRLALEHYEEGITTWSGIYEKYIYPVYPMSYGTFLRILGEGQLIERIKDETV